MCDEFALNTWWSNPKVESSVVYCTNGVPTKPIKVCRYRDGKMLRNGDKVQNALFLTTFRFASFGSVDYAWCGMPKP